MSEGREGRVEFPGKAREGCIKKRNLGRVSQSGIHGGARTRYVQVGFRLAKGKAYGPGDGLCRRWEDLPSLVCLEIKNIPCGRFRQVNHVARGTRHGAEKY